jgi:23S rRNA (cytidine1920-2'-O)/16S rRNA (cytidine1409-2'-O)-methyltransferase
VPFVSRAGQKLDHALSTFQIDVAGVVCADLGANAGGFTDCLLQRGAKKVYAIDTGYGSLEYKLRKDPRVIVMERTNAMHAVLAEPMDFICIDVAWTKQKHILPPAARMLGPSGTVVSLIKPHYEAEASQLRGGVLREEHLDSVLSFVQRDCDAAGFDVIAQTPSPLRGAKGNAELLWLLRRR